MKTILSDPSLVGFLTSLFFLTGLFLYGFFYILKRQSELQKRERELENKATDMINSAQKNAVEIIARGAKNAESLLTQTKSFKEGIETELKNILNSEVNDYRTVLNEKLSEILSNYQSILSQTGNLYAESIREATLKLKENQQKNADAFKSMLSDESLTAKFYIQRKIDEELEKAKIEIDEYKEEERKKIEKSVRNIIINLSEDVFEGSITLDQQEKLIFKALEEAQKKNVLVDV